MSAACSGTTNSSAAPVPAAIVVRGTDATRGLGCGTGAGDVYKYVAIATAAGQPLGRGVYDCFADATFIRPNVPFYSTVEVSLFVYSQPAFTSSQGQIEAAGVDRTALARTAPTWTAACTATYLPDVETFAACARPTADASSDAGTASAAVVVSLTSLPKEAGTVSCNTDFTGVRGSFRTSTGTTGDLAARPCRPDPSGPSALVVEPLEAGVDVVVEVELLADAPADAGAGAAPVVIGATTCRAKTSAGLTSSAVCDAVR